MQFWTLDEIQHHAMADHEVGEEISPGVTITRRRILQVGIAGVAGLLAAGCGGPRSGRLPTDDPSLGALTIEELLARVRPEARQMIASKQPDEPAYLEAVSSLLARYQPEAPWSMREPREGRWSMDTVARMPPVIVFEIHMRPGSKIDLHDHRHYNGVLLCRQGSVRCRNFDIVQPDGRQLDIAAGEVPSNDDFLIRQNRDSILVPGRRSMLSRDRDNIHLVEAGPEGCVMSDLFTHFRPDARSYSIEWDGKPLTRGGDLYKVSWRS